MKTHQTKRVYRVRTKSGIMGWRTRLRNNYVDYNEWQDNSDLWGLTQRIGYSSAMAAWRANPVVEGSTNSADFKKVVK